MQCGAARKYLYSLETPDSGAEALPASAEVAEARAHVAGCAACQEFFAAEQRLSAFLRARAPREKPSATLREQVLARIAEERKPAPGASRGFGQPHRAMVLSLVGVLIISALLVGLWLSQRRARVTPQQLIAILVDDHAVTFPSRAEITSSDSEVVQKWFRGRVDFAIRLPRTSDPQLIGGRLCDLKGRLAALVFYQHPQSRVSLFILDGSDLRLPEDQLVRIDGKRCLLDARKGYNVVLWQERGLLYSLVSDAHNAELLQLAEKF
jgi:anti-sigma factor RsiW